MHHNKSDIHILIIRYLDNSSTLDEKKELLQWIKFSDENLNEFTEIRELWLTSDVALSDDKELDTALEKLQNRILLNSKPLRKQVAFKWHQIAAVFLVLLSVGYAIYTRNTSTRITSHVIIQNQLITAVGSKGRFVLPDSSVVWLNSGSKLIYPEYFDKTGRNVILEGEAYFQINEDKTRPFVVKTEEVDIEVLGTSFNIANYPGSSSIETVLLSGSIVARLNETGKTTQLIPDQLLIYHKETGKAEIGITSSKYHIDWIKDRLIFDNDCLSDIIISLEGWYTAQIDCPKAFANEQRLSFTVRGESLEEILSSMSFIIPMKYTIDNKYVKIIPENDSLI